MTGLVKISIWHNVTRDGAGRHTGPLGFTPGDQMVKVFTCTTQARGRTPEAIAEDAFAAFNNAPHTSEDAALARRYFQRRLRSLSFPGNSPCCGRSCCVHSRAVCPDRRRGRRPSERPASVSQTQGGHTDDGQDLAAAGTTARPAREVRRG
jgi:hypothetical protein